MSEGLILASASPRRQELLKLLGAPFRVVTSGYVEPPAPTTPIEIARYVQDLALNKASEVADRHPGDWIVGADTLVTLSEDLLATPLGKPRNLDHARQMLGALSGRKHWVYTGIAVRRAAPREELAVATYARTGVTFRTLTSRMIDAYLSTGESMDKAGSYGAQGRAAPLIEGFDGDYFNVVGLPLCALGKLLEDAGFIWPGN